MHFPNWNSFAKIGPTIPQPFGQSGRLSIKSSPRVRKQPPSPLRLFTYDTCRSINGNALGFDCLIYICPLFSLKWKKSLLSGIWGGYTSFSHFCHNYHNYHHNYHCNLHYQHQIFFRSYAQNVVFDVKKEDQVARIGGCGGEGGGFR